MLTHVKYINLDTLEYSVVDIRTADIESLKISDRLIKLLKSIKDKEVYLPDRNSVDDLSSELLGIPIDGFGCAESYPSGRITIRESILYFTNSVVFDKYAYKLLIFYSLLNKSMHFGVSRIKNWSYKPFVEFNLDIVPFPSYYGRCVLQDSVITRGIVNINVKCMSSLFELKANNTGCIVNDKLQVLDKMPYSEYIVSPSIETLVAKRSILQKLETLVIPNTVEYLICDKIPNVGRTKPSISNIFISKDKHYTKPFLINLLEWFYLFEEESKSVSEEYSLSEIVALLSKYLRVEFI